MEVSGQVHASAALTTAKGAPAPIGWEVGSSPETFLTMWSREKSVASAGNRIPAVQPGASRYTD
jgi:hypothetical protein